MITAAIISIAACSSQRSSTASTPFIVGRNGPLVIIEHDPKTDIDSAIVVSGDAVPIKATGRGTVYGRLQRMAQVFPNEPVLVKASSLAHYGSVLSVLDDALAVGYREFGFASRVGSPSPGAFSALIKRFINRRFNSTPGPTIDDFGEFDVYVTAKNVVCLDARPVTLDGLFQAVKKRVTFNRKKPGQGPSARVAFSADYNASFGEISTVLDALSTAGATDVLGPRYHIRNPNGSYQQVPGASRDCI
jgi:biopolymer transport protein ExbD